jgi:hypothetical protein
MQPGSQQLFLQALMLVIGNTNDRHSVFDTFLAKRINLLSHGEILIIRVMAEEWFTTSAAA